MNNKDYYRDTFDEIHVSSDMLGKVMNMDMNKKEFLRKNTLKYAISAAAALLICFLVSNGISYAATGEPWTEKIKLWIDGQEVERDITWQQNEDGSYYGVVEVESAENYYEFHIVEPLEDDDKSINVEDVLISSSELTEEDGRQYLVIGDTKIDITEDFADGKCQGSFEQSGETYTYIITGTIEEYSISIEN